MNVALYVLAALAALFVVSGVLPRWREDKARLARVTQFERQYPCMWADASQ